ncbi:MAG: hypothetical protein A2176_11770 [Spirochaetes bacterium RBG_13_51_14]|nr:MAG: hypothetical protein A2176_11770 [Spirochaetes bacterium RBG_13_51_14]
MIRVSVLMLPLLMVITTSSVVPGDVPWRDGIPLALNSVHAAETDGAESPLTFKSVIGTWTLKYSGNYGYNFSFYSNYRALIVLYLNMETLIFKGVYTIEDNKLKINIYEMKEQHRAGGINRGFVKAKSSYFLFGGYKTTKNRKETLRLRPLAIIIDGNNSEGYFEPLIKLTKI